MTYALRHLSAGAPVQQRNSFYATNIQRLRQEILTALMASPNPTTQITTKQLDRLERQWTEQLLREAAQRRLVGEVYQEDPGTLQRRLTDPRAVVQMVAMQAIADRRLHLEGDLIERLDDRSEIVSQAARRALIRLARGTDFGPPSRPSKGARARAIARWQSWLALQRLAADRAGSSPSGAPDFQTAVNGVLGKNTNVLVAADPEIIRLRDELIRADGDSQEEVLARLKDAKGVAHTEAIALAIPQLPDAMQAKARAALTERMTRMTAQTLRDKFEQDDAEVRQAAARACAAKEARDLIPDLIALLDDPEPAVVQAAYGSLKQLTYQDFGPPADATPAERVKALAAWKDWWQQQAPN
jgi:HEAT repeat protein